MSYIAGLQMELDNHKNIIRFFDVLDFFDSLNAFERFREGFLRYVNENFSPVDDMPGCLRYHLDTKDILEFLDIYLSSTLIVNTVSEMLSCDRYFVKFVRYRNPLKDGGLQNFHRDWDHGCKTRRLEIFIIFDDFLKENGCLEVYIDEHIIPVLLPKGSLIVMDSTLSHRGTTNQSGESRILIDVHVGSELMSGEEAISYYPR